MSGLPPNCREPMNVATPMSWPAPSDNARPCCSWIANRHVRYDVASVRFILFKPGIMASVKAGLCGGAQHFAFRIRWEEVSAALEHLHGLGVPFDGPNHDPGKISIYFDDPAGNRVEFLAPVDHG